MDRSPIRRYCVVDKATCETRVSQSGKLYNDWAKKNEAFGVCPTSKPPKINPWVCLRWRQAVRLARAVERYLEQGVICEEIDRKEDGGGQEVPPVNSGLYRARQARGLSDTGWWFGNELTLD